MLGESEITFKTCHNLNRTTFLTEIEEKPLHSCEEVLRETYVARPDSSDQLIDDPNLTLWEFISD